MSESGQRLRPRRLTAIDMMDEQIVQEHECVESPLLEPRKFPDDRIFCGEQCVGDTNNELGAAPDDKILSQSMGFNDFEAGYDTRAPEIVEVTEPGDLTLPQTMPHGSQITRSGGRPNFVDPDRTLLEDGCRSEHQDLKPRDQNENSGKKNLRFPGQELRRYHRSPIHCWDSKPSPDLSSHLLHQNLASGNIGVLHPLDDRCQYPVRPLPTEAYPCTLYPPSDLDCRAAPDSLTNDTAPIIVGTRYGLHPASTYRTRSSRGGTWSSFHPQALLEFEEPFCTSGPALAPYWQAQRDPRFDKLCNNYHLRGACVLGDGVCKYIHGTISEAQLKELKRIAKGIVCKYGLGCEDPLCYAGHECPYNPCPGVTCKFPPQMHSLNPEDSWNQAVKRTRRSQRSYRDHVRLRSHDDELTVLSSTVGRQKNREERSASTVNDRVSELPQDREHHRSSCEEIKREIDDLMDDVAPWRTIQTDSRGDVLPPRRPEVSESEMDLFEAELNGSSSQRRTKNSSGHRRRRRGRHVTNEPARNYSEEKNGRRLKGRDTDLLRYMPSRKIQAIDHGSCSELRGRRQSNASSSDHSHGKGRNSRIGKTDSWRPAGARRH